MLQPEQSVKSRDWRFVLIAVIAGLGGLLFGYGTGVVAGVLLFLAHDFQLNGSMQGLFVAVALAGAALGAAISGLLADRWGRRRILLATAALFVFGSLLAALANSVALLFLGRAFLGLAIGTASTVTPLYLAEITTPERRGAIVTINQLYISIGIFISYGVDLLFSDFGSGWRWMLGFGALPALMLFVGMWILPESPRWLIRQGLIDRAKSALQYLRSTALVAEELESLQQGNANTEPMALRSLFNNWKLRRLMVIAVGLAVFQQITGINIVLYYAPKILQETGLSSPFMAILATGGIGLVNVLATIISMRFLDSLGRRKLLLWGLWGMLISLLALSLEFLTNLQGALGAALIVVTSAVFVAFFAMSLGPIFWLLISEIFPLAIRGRAMSLATVINWLSNMLVAGVFLDLVGAIGRGATFLIYALITFLAILFTLKLVPETKGLSLEEIERQFISIP
ncbi:sugar porter family MFS transporter [Acidithiobacillus thiooxidans]|uniref:sugar porter family MFS transporter n=1 Tax=Acidithiobacillus thiooxidans TaxID=930 RepID=UPI001C06A0C4|nr:sugar porter family MFS transporter [Acidithiobacillus thiooxidans]MBU2839876.1 sugar porter family MFS transporter [Acidithiobacillus thiooxidans]